MALKEKADKELAQYNMELKVCCQPSLSLSITLTHTLTHTHPHTHTLTLQELVRVIDHDRRLKEFMSHKDQERTEAHMEMEEAKKRKSM